MKKKLIILGCGSSVGTARIDGFWGKCRRNNKKNLWQKISDMNKVKIIQMGIPALSVYQFDSKDNLKYKTLISQEMLKLGYLATTGIYVSISHTDEILDKYAENLNEIFKSVLEEETDELRAI